LEVKLDGELAYMICTSDMIKRTGSDISATENFVNYSRSVKGAKVGLLLEKTLKHQICIK
jgi:nanoRNase/pAp phosphatase (c-di-AMP/oligoRNAs hydrolase)